MPPLDMSKSKVPIRLQLRLPALKPQESAGACRKTNAILTLCWLQSTLTNRLHFLTILPCTFPCGRAFARLSNHASSIPRRYTKTGRSRTQPNCWELGFVLRCMMTEECRHRSGEIRFICALDSYDYLSGRPLD